MCGKFVYSPHVFIYSIIYLQYGFMDVYLILWFINQHYFIYFLLKLFQYWILGVFQLAFFPFGILPLIFGICERRSNFFFYSFLLFLFYYSWFTMFCQFLLYSKATQFCVCVCVCVCVCGWVGGCVCVERETHTHILFLILSSIMFYHM